MASVAEVKVDSVEAAPRGEIKSTVLKKNTPAPNSPSEQIREFKNPAKLHHVLKHLGPFGFHSLEPFHISLMLVN